MLNVPLSDIFQVKGRFRRSVHLERDFYTENALDGYVLTATARDTLSRVVSTLENEKASKAWSLTGPYGSGKSAFALFAAKLLGDSDAPTTQQALDLLKRGDVSLYERFTTTNGNGKPLSDFCPVLISGERSPLSIALLNGLENGLKSFGIPSNSSLPKKIRKLLKITANDPPLQASEITHLFESATLSIKKKGGRGLLLVIDELGKFLEYATQHPTQGDMFVLQTLAEFADRSGKTPLFLMTILHQAFELYAEHAGKSEQEEWTKVQGRFEDIAFLESTEHVLRLVGTALEKRSDVVGKDILKPAINLGLKPRQFDENEFIHLLENCLPLHPTVALLIGPIFRRFAQNERSLFAFLSSSEPNGLQDFLSLQHYKSSFLPTFSLADLCDYLNTTHGNRLYTSQTGKKWAEIESTITQLADPSPMVVRLIKTIGLLGIANEPIPNLKASEELLYYALDDNTEEFADEFKRTLSTLKRRSIITYRSYNNVYALWEGSDIDIEVRLRDAAAHIDTKVALATDLSRYMPTNPLVARRHLFQTGTLRYFAVRYTDLENFDTDLREPLGDEDGLVLYALPASEKEVTKLIEKANDSNAENRKEVLIGIPRSIGLLRDAVTQLAYLHWIDGNTPELDGDAVARRELSIRMIESEREVSNRLTEIFGDNSEDFCTWYHKGQPTGINSTKARNTYLSRICDDVYNETPLIRNELINRRKISGAATTARKKLIQAMLENGDQENLGITGYPPEMSIYRSLLWNTGVHREVESVWGFHPPKIDDRNRIAHTWNAIEEFLEACESDRQSVVDLYQQLKNPPLGLREGPLPILLCAVMLHYKTEIALYENGSFIADWSMPVFERLLKAPQQFDLKRFRMTGIRTDVFSQLLQMLNYRVETEKTDLLMVVSPLMRFIAQLPKYTLGTQELSDNAKNLRKVIQDAREPDELLFKQIPKALDFPSFGAETATDENTVSDFFNTLQDALSELEQAYDVLLNAIEQMLVKAFNLIPNREELRAELADRAEPLFAVTIETQLKGFLIQVCSGGHDFTSWIEAIATYLAKKPPTSWHDIDKAQFEINLSQLARKFRHFEAISYEKRAHAESPTGEPIRIGITRPNHPEQEQVVTLSSTAEEQANKIEHEIEQVFDKFDVDGNSEFRLAVLARISQKLMQEEE
ncbi:hypothetical protein J4G07_15760 [Candidatus Poribacteria bacterium]|nr:hypothetical protein [Candidatus Poribacteria bacterium]